MTSRFADTFFFVALLDRKDQHHSAVTDYLATSHDFLITTRWVLAEVANALGSSALRSAAAAWLNFIESDPSTLIVKSNDELYLKGLQLYSDRADKDWSLTDCISFVVMQEHRISDALTGDHHFEQAGFKALFAA
jgi:uncharacterized protein